MSYGTKSKGDLGDPDWVNLIEAALGNGNPVQPSSYVIFLDGSDYTVRNGVDGTIDATGTNFATVWNSIVTAGDKIYLPDNSYTVSAALTYKENMTIEGAAQTDDTGEAGTILVRDGDHAIFTSDAGTLRFVDFSNLTLKGDGKGVSASPLVSMGTSCSYLKFRNVTLRDGGGDGVDMDGVSWNLSMYGCRGYNLTGDLVSKVTPDTGTMVGLYNCTATHGGYLADLYGVRGVTIHCGGGDNWDSGALRLQACSGDVAGGDYEGDAVTGTPDHMVRLIGSRVHFHGNRIYKAGTGANYGAINVTGICDGAGLVQGNMIENTVGDYSIIVAADCTDWKIFDNDLDKTQSGWATGRAVFRGNSIFISENSGTDTLPNAGPPSTVAVAHGLSFTPTAPMIHITLLENPTATPGAVWVDTIGAANFTVNCENDPGVSALDFAWSVRMDRVEP